jgi:hypothetical protein
MSCVVCGKFVDHFPPLKLRPWQGELIAVLFYKLMIVIMASHAETKHQAGFSTDFLTRFTFLHNQRQGRVAPGIIIHSTRANFLDKNSTKIGLCCFTDGK